MPFLNIDISVKLFIASFLIFVFLLTVKTIVYKRSLSLHRAHASIFSAYVICSSANVIFTTFLYWYWALSLCFVFSVIYAFSTAREVAESNSEERMGIYGLNKEIRRIRGEIFNDMSIEEQIAFRKTVKETAFSRVLFIIVTMLLPAAVIGIYYLLNIGYQFYPAP